MLPFFAKFDDVAAIKRTDIVQYIAFRRGQGEHSPMPQTINRENSVLRQMLRYASDRGWLKTIPRIENEADRLTKRRRRHFTADEYRKLHRTARKRATEFDGQELLTRQGWNRKLLYDVILILANTGMRVDELKTIIWRNVDWDDSTILLERAGKTRSSRRVIARATAMLSLKRIQERRLQYLSRYKDQKLADNEKVISLPDGTEVISLKKGFERLLDACEFKYERKEDRHALTSLRHTYATFRLTTKSGKRATMRALAKQMGTSERMITLHYGHDEIADYREELAG
jgi:integrase